VTTRKESARNKGINSRKHISLRRRQRAAGVPEGLDLFSVGENVTPKSQGIASGQAFPQDPVMRADMG